MFIKGRCYGVVAWGLRLDTLPEAQRFKPPRPDPSLPQLDAPTHQTTMTHKTIDGVIECFRQYSTAHQSRNRSLATFITDAMLLPKELCEIQTDVDTNVFCTPGIVRKYQEHKQ